ncbi:hypothetical protein Pfo_005446 [Paulownia fortunei]|nr:hypothetical protein Pfo_005446 [Paulownia fortunei]
MIKGPTRWRVEKKDVTMTTRCFNGWWLVVLAVFTASLLVLPPMLPPLPPPPMLLMLFPVGIMALLMALAFSPTNAAANIFICSSI